MKRWGIIVLVFAILFFGFLFSRDSLATIAWQKYHSPAIALALTPKDSKLLMNLGNYYFNGGAYYLKITELAYEKVVL